MKIALFTDVYAPWGSGGIATSIKAQKQALEEAGHEVIIFCPGFDAKEKNVVTVPSHRWVKIEKSVLAKRPPVVERFVLQKFPQFGEFDLVHVHYETSCSLAGIRLARRFGVPLVQTMHGREDQAIMINVMHPFKTIVAGILNFLHQCYLPHSLKVHRDKGQAKTLAQVMMWRIMVNQAQYADVVVTPSKHFAAKIKKYGVAKPILPVSNGVPDQILEVKFSERSLSLNADAAPSGDQAATLRLLWNSRVSKEKRIMPFLRALNRLERPYILYVYGRGNQLRRAKRYVKTHGLQVKFEGQREHAEIYQCMRSCHLSVNTSYDFDTQGMTLLEAMVTGLPVFFCDPDMKEVVPAGSYVFAESHDSLAMARALEKLQAAQITTMSRVMLQNRHLVVQSAQLGSLLEVYQLALKKRLR